MDYIDILFRSIGVSDIDILLEEWNSRGSGQGRWWWNIKTRQEISTERLDHTPFACRNLAQMGIDFDKLSPDEQNLIDNGLRKSYDSDVLEIITRHGWVRCFITGAGRGLMLNARSVSDAKACVKFYRKEYSEIVVDVGWEYNTASRRLANPQQVVQFLDTEFDFETAA